MSNMENDSDYEQVFIINETDDYSSSNRTSTQREDDDFRVTDNSVVDVNNYSSSLVTVFGIFAVISSFAVFFTIFFSSFVHLGKYETYQLAFVASLCLILVFLLFLGCRTPAPQEPATAECVRTQVQRESFRPRKKKFNNLQEYKASQEYQREKAKLESMQTDEEKQTQQDREHIDTAIKALVSLGFKIKRATDLVSRGLDSGINPSETQVLVRYALSNNNKA